MIISESVSNVVCQQEQPASLEQKVALLTAEIAGLRTQMASIERSLACLRTGTIRFAKREGAPDFVLKQLEKEG